MERMGQARGVPSYGTEFCAVSFSDFRLSESCLRILRRKCICPEICHKLLYTGVQEGLPGAKVVPGTPLVDRLLLSPG